MKNLDIASQHCHSHIVGSLDPLCLLCALPINLVHPQQLDSAHSHQLDVIFVKASHKNAGSLSLGNERIQLGRHLSWGQHNSRVVAQ